MWKAYDPKKPSVYIIYLDANNLYGWAMSQALADGDIHWIPKEDFAKINWLEVPDDGEKGYFVECDLSVPKELHDKFNGYPLAP